MKCGITMQIRFDPSGYSVNLSEEVQLWAAEYGSEMMDAGELIHLAATLAAYSWEREAIVVEIGAYVGHTTVFMARILQMLGKQVPILSIDPFERAQPDPLNPQGIYSAYLENIRKHKVESSCLPLASFSQDAAPVVPDKIGVLVVDGGHHYPVVSKDLALYGPKLLDGGFIFIDDYGPSYPDVVRAVDEYFIASSRFTIVHKDYFIVAQRSTDIRSLSSPMNRAKDTVIEAAMYIKRSSTE
jgi:hypothetical protein